MIRAILLFTAICGITVSCGKIEPITQGEQNGMIVTALEHAFDEEFMGDAGTQHPVGDTVLVHFQEFPNNEFPETVSSRNLEPVSSVELAEKKDSDQPFYYLELHFDDERPTDSPVIYVVTRGFYYDRLKKQLNRVHAESLGVGFTKVDGRWTGSPTFHIIE